jgi:hypothetical protein
MAEVVFGANANAEHIAAEFDLSKSFVAEVLDCFAVKPNTERVQPMIKPKRPVGNLVKFARKRT